MEYAHKYFHLSKAGGLRLKIDCGRGTGDFEAPTHGAVV